MGFFFTETEAAAVAKPAAGRKRAAVAESTALQATERGCAACTLKPEWGRLSSPRMALVGPEDADILILGEAPGAEEDLHGRPFIGKAGQTLRKVLPAASFQRVAWQNVVRCRPSGDNRDPTPLEQHCCSLHLEADLASRPFKAILSLGTVPLGRFVQGTPVSFYRGLKTPVLIGDKPLWMFPTFHPSYIDRMGGDSFRNAAYAVWRADIRRFFREVDGWEPPRVVKFDPAEVQIVNTLDEARAQLALCGEVVGIDVESHNFKPYLKGSKLLTAAVSDGARTIAWAINHSEQVNDWGGPFLLEVVRKKRWVAHNAGFEMLWLDWLGYEPVPDMIEDSMAVVRLLFKRTDCTGLGDSSMAMLGCNVKNLVKVSVEKLDSTPLDTVLRYNGLDAKACLLVWQRGRPQINKALYRHCIMSMLATSAMERTGVPINVGVNERLDAYWAKKADEIVHRASKLYEVKQFERARQTAFNLGSGDQVGAALVEYGKVNLPRTKTGYKTDEATLRASAAGNPLAEAVVDYREAVKNRSTYIQGWRNHAAAAKDGFIHPSYTTLRTATLRLSSNEPNIQNVPVRSDEGRKLREQLGVPDAHVLVKFDAGQLEARTYCMQTKDPVLRKYLLSGADIHGDWRDKLLAKFPEYYDLTLQRTGYTEEKKVLKAARDTIKSDFVFQTFFGGSPAAAAERVGAPLAIMQELNEEFWRTFDVAHAWVRKQRESYRETGTIITLSGLERNTVIEGGNEVINTPVQGTAAHIVNACMGDLAQMARDRRDNYFLPRIQIHDDLTFFLPDDERLVGYIEEIHPVLTKVRYNWNDCAVDLGGQAGPHLGQHRRVCSIQRGLRQMSSIPENYQPTGKGADPAHPPTGGTSAKRLFCDPSTWSLRAKVKPIDYIGRRQECEAWADNLIGQEVFVLDQDGNRKSIGVVDAIEARVIGGRS